MNSYRKNRLFPTRLRAAATLLSLSALLTVPALDAEPASAGGGIARRPAVISDSLYQAHHPRLLFTPAELPALYEKVRDGGYDDSAYAYIRYLATAVYAHETEAEMLVQNYISSTLPNLGLATHLEEPKDLASKEIGRRATLYLVDNHDVDDNVFMAPLRLRSLAFGYDMFFFDGPDSERTMVRDEIETYMDTMLTTIAYEVWRYRPYLSNISTMIASALGLAAVCLAGETDPQRVEAALAMADGFADEWLSYQVDPEGSCQEGAMYTGWCMRNLVYYFWARKRYDGYDYAAVPRIRNIERWIAFSVLPGGGAKVNNVNDTAYLNRPLSRHITYFEWAQNEWESRVSAWLWARLAGPPYGYDPGRLADKSSTVLWHRSLEPVQPDDVLPRRLFFSEMGLYYFRTGWQEGASSDDVVFSFHSGKFQGGHAQEDRNHFTLYGYGEMFAVDNGYDKPARHSEAHNMIFIDGKGQHNADSMFGTDGHICEFLLSGFADYLHSDATDAYTTYSEFNEPGTPFPGYDWDWGYDGGNPVEYALRRVVVVHDSLMPPYILLIDDIKKDGAPHTYDWRMHTLDSNTVDAAANPIRITGSQGQMDLHVLNPPFGALEARLVPFDNQNLDPNSTIISLSLVDTASNFTFLMLPLPQSATPPGLFHIKEPWGVGFEMEWGDDMSDVFLLNLSGDTMSYTRSGSPPAPTAHRRLDEERASHGDGISIETDAVFALLRMSGGEVAQYLISNVRMCDVAGIPYVRIGDGTINAAMSRGVIHVDRDSADFVFYGPNVTDVVYRDRSLPIITRDGYISPDTSSGTLPPGAGRDMIVRAYPNPFNAGTTISVEIDRSADVEVVIYDPGGRLVKKLWRGAMPPGGNLLEWDGRNEAGRPVATGVYLLKAVGGGSETSLKLIVLR
jgi:hypothetical protein